MDGPLKISMIIPVYNGEKDVEKCLRSCTTQDILPENYEIIVINDGSTDSSLKIINRVAADYTNFIIIDKLNGGVSSARNSGLEVAKGKYIWFIDSDDWIESNCLSFLINIMEKSNLDALQINFKRVNQNEIVYSFFEPHEDSEILSPFDYIKRGHFQGFAWMTIFRKYIVDRFYIRFDPKFSLSEDLLFFLNVLSYSKRIQRLKINPYYYKEREDSASNKLEHHSRFLLLNEIKKLKNQDIIKEYVDFLIPEIIFGHININIYNLFALKDELSNNGYSKIKLNKKNRIKLKLFFSIYNFNIFLSLFILNIIKRVIKKVEYCNL